MEIGDRIRILRLTKKMTQREVIEGIASITYLSKVENNQTQPTEAFIHKISERLHIDPKLLLQPTPNDLNHKLEKIYDDFWESVSLTDEEYIFLQFQMNEVQLNRTYLMIYTTLIRYHYAESRLKEAKELYTQSVDVINAYDSTIEDRLYFNYYLTCGRLLLDLHFVEKANDWLLKGLSYSTQADAQDIAKLYFSLSLVNQRLNEDKLACLYYSEKSLHIQKQLDNPSRLAMLLFVRAIQFHLVNQPWDAMDCLEQAKACFWEKDNPNLRPIIEYSIGRVYHAGKEYDLAIEHYNKSIQFYQNSIFPEKSLQVHKRLIEVYLEQREWRLLEGHLIQAQTIADRSKEIYYDVELDILRASVLKKQGHHANYERFMKKLIENCANQGYTNHVKNLAGEFAEYFYYKQSYKKAANYYHQAMEAEQRQKKR